MKSIWRPLEPGEPIGVVALSGPVDPVKLEAGLEVLRGWGHPVIEAVNLRAEDGYLAGSDAERLAGLDEILAAGVRWVMAARGGYGSTRLLPSVSLERLRDREVSLIGYSDLTAFLNPLAQNGGAVQIHGPMVAAGLARPHNAKRLRALLTGELSGGVLFRFPEGAVARSGRAAGPSLGGNLTLVTALLGTPWEPDFDGCVLFLEEVGEPLYRLDRMLTHLRGSGRLRNVKALIGGSLRGCGPVSDRSDGWRRMLVEAAPAEVPVVVGLPFGHGAANLAFPIGATVEID
ncbi:MAG: LD-carboxypeptidase, partial [Thermoanaerobaculales bacterium]|nr:LD-carboxypeptidase [Thermoanaerobaculales bacterium]